MRTFTSVQNHLATLTIFLLLTSGITACGSGPGGATDPLVSDQPVDSPSSPDDPQEGIDAPIDQPLVVVDLDALKLEDLVNIAGTDVPPRTFDRVDWTSRCIEFDEILCQFNDFHVRFGYGDTQGSLGGSLPLETGMVFSTRYDGLQPNQECLTVLIAKTGNVKEAVKIGGVVRAEVDGTLLTHIYKLFNQEIGQQIRNAGIEGYATALLCVDPNSVNGEVVKVSETYFARIGGDLVPWPQYEDDNITITPVSVGGNVIRRFKTQICGLPYGLSLSARNFMYDRGDESFVPQGESALSVTVDDDSGDDPGCASYTVYGGETKGGNAIVYEQEDGVQYIKTF